MEKATAVAHPIQGLVKYHGLRDVELRIPLHDSISVCVAPYETRTTVEVRPDLDEDVFEIDGQAATGRAFDRAELVVDHLRNLAGRQERIKMRSENNFMSNIGLGASSSGFAALALAAHNAFGMELGQRELTKIARLGAGSASRAVSGAFSYWYAGETHDSSYAERITDQNALQLGIVMAIIPAHKNTDDAHSQVLGSAFMPCRTAFVRATIGAMRQAILDGDFSTVGRMAEQDSLSLHAVTMTGEGNPLYWQPDTLRVFHEVRRLRSEGLECYFSVDTGATVYVNCRPEDTGTVEKAIADLGVKTAVGSVGGPAHIVKKHLF
jgi:phosphomevalonate decarboxylase